MAKISKSSKLQNVCYDIRGPVLREATRLEDEGHRVLKLNIGNPAAFDMLTPDEILQDVIRSPLLAVHPRRENLDVFFNLLLRLPSLLLRASAW